jgi:hypothetical protein
MGLFPTPSISSLGRQSRLQSPWCTRVSSRLLAPRIHAFRVPFGSALHTWCAKFYISHMTCRVTRNLAISGAKANPPLVAETSCAVCPNAGATAYQLTLGSRGRYIYFSAEFLLAADVVGHRPLSIVACQVSATSELSCSRRRARALSGSPAQTSNVGREC